MVVSAQPWYAQHGRTVKNVKCEGCDAATTAAPDQARSALDVVYAITYYPGATDANDAKPIIVKPGERVTADITLTPVPALNVRIKLAGALSQGVTMTQRVFDGDPINVPNEGLVMGKGEITIGGLPPGHFVLAFTSAGKERSSREVEVDISGDADISESEGTRASDDIPVLPDADRGWAWSRSSVLDLLDAGLTGNQPVVVSIGGQSSPAATLPLQ